MSDHIPSRREMGLSLVVAFAFIALMATLYMLLGVNAVWIALGITFLLIIISGVRQLMKM